MEPYWGPHFFGWMWIFPAIFLVVCLVFLFTFLSRGPGRWWANPDGPQRNTAESARDILDRRFAAGELNAAQYEEMKRVLDRR